MQRSSLLIFLLFFYYSYSFSQSDKKEIFVKFTDNEINADGMLDEPDWSLAKTAYGFYEYFPDYSADSKNPAEIKVMHDEEFLYVGIKVMGDSKKLKVNSLKRDFQAPTSDNITMIFDTFNDATNAFVIGSNHIGVQRDMLMFNGGVDIRNSWDMTWDVKWMCESKIYDNYYITEWKIPFNVFKYREGETKWRVGAYQRNTENKAWNLWHQVPKNQEFSNLAFMGDMYFEKPLGKSKAKKSIIPYINGITYNDYEENISGNEIEFGGDAKITIDNSLTLDLTLNPDFSQVEVDQQVTNLTRYEVSLPEKRQFFIENSDLFASFGDKRDANPFFSRRIGIAKDLDGNSIQNKITAGMRLSGKINSDFRIGILNMQTEEDLDNEIAATNNAILALQHKVFSRSNISFMFINKQATKDYNFIDEDEEFNRVIGIDYNLASIDSKWTGKYFFHKSFSPNENNKDFSMGMRTSYNSKNVTFRVSGVYVGDNYRSDLGFIKRTGILKINPDIGYTFWPENKKLQSHKIEVTPVIIWRPELNYQLSDYFIISRWDGQFNNGDNFNIAMRNQYTYLYDDFDPTRTENSVPLPANSEYHYTNIEVEYNNYFSSNEFTYSVEQSFGELYNGSKLSTELRFGYRIQPKFTTSVEINYDRIRLPDPYPSADIILIAPRFEFTFTKNLYWATLLQYSNQRENLSLNTRLQWRFAPLSDLFLVYNDNYYTEDRYNSIFIPRVKNRSLNLKLTYWLDF